MSRHCSLGSQTLVMLISVCAVANSTEGERVSLLHDTKFAEGFVAAFIYSKEFSGGRRPPLGQVKAYRDISPWQVHLIPDGKLQALVAGRDLYLGRSGGCSGVRA